MRSVVETASCILHACNKKRRPRPLLVGDCLLRKCSLQVLSRMLPGVTLPGISTCMRIIDGGGIVVGGMVVLRYVLSRNPSNATASQSQLHVAMHSSIIDDTLILLRVKRPEGHGINTPRCITKPMKANPTLTPERPTLKESCPSFAVYSARAIPSPKSRVSCIPAPQITPL